MTLPDDAGIDDFLSGYGSDIADLAQALRAFVLDATPEAVETLHVGWKVISYGSRGRGRISKFCAIAPHARWVNLQFHRGTELRDSTGLLKGTGKAMRHAQLTSSADLTADLASLIEEAAQPRT